MATAKEMLERLERLDLDQIRYQAVKDTLHLIPELQRDQLSKGLGADGKHLRPKYSEDPYFDTPGQAHAYAVWKSRIGSLAPFDVPDLFINGYTHYHIYAVQQRTMVSIGINVPWAADLDRKYRGDHLGLTDTNVRVYRRPLLQNVRRQIRFITRLP